MFGVPGLAAAGGGGGGGIEQHSTGESLVQERRGEASGGYYGYSVYYA